MNQDLPETIRVGAYTISITKDEKYLKKYSEENETAIAGLSELDKQQITIDDTFPHDYVADTVLHEVLHMCLSVSPIDINEELSKHDSEDAEELFISTITNILLDTMRRNPQLMRYLLK